MGLFPFTMSTPSDDVPTRAGVTPAAETHQEKAPLTSISDIGIRTDRNARHRRTMEDTHTYVDGFMDDSKCGSLESTMVMVESKLLNSSVTTFMWFLLRSSVPLQTRERLLKRL